jgi:hypothetical protein
MKPSVQREPVQFLKNGIVGSKNTPVEVPFSSTDAGPELIDDADRRGIVRAEGENFCIAASDLCYKVFYCRLSD